MRLTKFGTYELPLWNKRDGVSMGNMGGAVVDIIGGAGYDAYGSGTAPESALTVTTSFEIIETSTTAVQTARDAIRALGGTKERLWAHFPDGSERFADARLARVRMERRFEYIYYQPVDLDFDIVSPGWHGEVHGAPWYLDAGETLDSGLVLDLLDYWTPTSSPLTATVNNGGNRTVTNAVLTVTAGTSTISAIKLVCGSCDWTYSGTVAIGKALVIDCGLKSVVNDGADAYSAFALNSGHAVADWLQLQPGDNTVTITYTGNATDDATFALGYYDGWM